MEFPSLNALILVLCVHIRCCARRLNDRLQFDVVLSSRRGGRGKERMWKIRGEGAARYPEIGMSFLARNFAPIEVSYLFAGVSCSRLRFPSFFLLFPFFRFLSAPFTRVFIYIFPPFSLSFDEITHFPVRDTSSLSLAFSPNNLDLTSK